LRGDIGARGARVVVADLLDKSDAWYQRWGSARGGFLPFAGTRSDDKVAPKPAVD